MSTSSKSAESAGEELGEIKQHEIKKMPFIVKFYDPEVKAKDRSGRSLEKMLEWEDGRLEHAHDYIQVWFPLPEGSPFNSSAPVIDKETCMAFRSRPELRMSLQKAFTRILKFYGFEPSYKGEDVHIYRCKNHIPSFRNWVVRSDHNHLRITRIIRSLRVLGLEQNAQAFYSAIKDVHSDYPGRIGARSMMYWQRAATRRLELPPDQDNNMFKGHGFLRELDEVAAVQQTLAPQETSQNNQAASAVETEKADQAGENQAA